MEIVQSIERGFSILEYLAKQSNGARITEISQNVALTKGTVSRLLKTFIYLGYVEQATDSKYQLTFKLYEIASQRMQNVDLVGIVQPLLLEMAKEINEVIHLVIRDGLFGVYVVKIEPNKSITMNTSIGMRKKLCYTAYGKCLLLDTTKTELENLWQASAVEKMTPFTITEFTEFYKEIEKTQKTGFAVDEQGVELDISCISVPIRNHKKEIIAAVSISYVANNISKKQLKNYQKIIVQYGEKISAQLGF
jgi:Transcriptional regulator